jgi:very-short-patch-repair endonuclease
MAPQTQARPLRDERKAGPSRERAVAALANRQHGVVARRQLLALGVGSAAIKNRLRNGHLHRVHRGVYAVGHARLSMRGHWLAAVLACGEGAVLSHRSAAALWGLIRPRGPIDVTSRHGWASRKEIELHEGRLHPEERGIKDGIPVTSVARTLFDLAEVLDERRLERTFEEADRLGLLEIRALERVCGRGHGRHSLSPIRRLIASPATPASGCSPLENRFAEFCREHLRDMPAPVTNVSILDHEVDAYWPQRHLVVEMDSWEFHHHRAAFEHDRARDAAMQAAGYRVIRLTHRRLHDEPAAVASQLRALLAAERDTGCGYR